MNKFKVLLLVCFYAAITTGASAGVIGSDPNGNYYVEGEASDFVNWASTNHSVSVEAGQTMMQTIWDASKPLHYTTSPTNGIQADLDILFTFAQPLVTCRLDYGSVVQEFITGPDGAWVQLEVTAASTGLKTKIYFHDGIFVGDDYNYDPAGAVPTGERHYTFTNIDDLVAGETEFTLNIAVQRSSTGTEQWGGSFLPDREALGYWPESDFIMSGTMGDNPNYCGDLNTQYPVADITGPEGVPDCYVNMYDLSLMAQLWFRCSALGNEDCTTLTTVLLEPFLYRESFFSSQPEHEAVIQATVSGLQATDILQIGARGQAGQEVVLTGDGVYELRYDLTGQSPGDCQIAVELATQGGTTLVGTEHEIKILPPSDLEVTFDKNRVCYVNGEPFFPIGLYHVNSAIIEDIESYNAIHGLPNRSILEHLQDIKDHGFNSVVHSWGFPDDVFRGLLVEAGLYWSPEIGWTGSAALRTLVETHKQDPYLLWWYSIDEAVGAELDKAIQDRAMFEEVDPYHPVAAATNKPDNFGDYLQAFDILMPTAFGTSVVADWTEGSLQAGQGRVPVWPVLQGFGMNPSDVPTPEKMRSFAFLALTHGATGLLWFTYAHPFEGFEGEPGYRDGWWYLPETPLWDEFALLNQEVNDLAPVLLSPSVEPVVTVADAAIHVLLKEYQGQYYLFAVNDSPVSVSCQFTGLIPQGNVEILPDGTIITPNGQGWADQLEGYATRVYRF